MKSRDNRFKDAVDPSAGSGQDLRQRAEALAGERAVRTPEDSAALSPEEIRKTIHELRVHQIELEMQNEELRTAQAQIEAGRARYLDLYDLAPVGYCTLSEQGMILEANLTAATLLGTARGALIKQPISRFILKEDQDIYYLHRKKLFETGEPQECDLRMGKPDGTNFWAHLSAIAAQGEDGAPVCRCVLSDITERKRSDSVLAFLAQSSPNSASGDFFQVLARYISETLDMGFVCIDRLDGDNLTAHTEAVYSNGRFEDNVSYALKDTPCGEVVGKQVCCFPASIKNLFPNDAVLQQMEAESYIGVTLWSHDGRPIGLIAVIGARPMTNRPQAESLLRLVAVRAAAELERKQAEEALRQSEEHFRNAFEHSAIGMALVSPEGNWLKVNKWVYDIVGYTADELMAKTFQDITHTQDLDTDLAFVRQMLAGEIETYQMEKRYFHKDGHIVWVLLTVSLVWDEQGAPLHFISQIQDITERKREQEAIRESELKFRTLVEASSSGIWKTDAAGHNTYVSPRWCEITGISEAAAAGQGWVSGLHPDDRIPVHTGWMKAATASASYSAEFRFVHSDGRFVWVLCQASPVKAGDHVVEWIGTITDITERKRAEDALRSSRQLLDATEALSAVGGWEWDVATQAMTWTDGTYRIHDFDPAAVPSGSPEHIARSLACYDPGDRPRVEEAFRRCVEAGEPYDLECGFTTAKGRQLSVRTMGRAIRENGRVVKVLGNLQDITEQKRAKEEVARITGLLRDVVDMVPAYICAKNSEGRFLLVNRKLADFYGIPVDTMTGMLHADLCEDEKELRAMLAADRQVIESGRAEVIPEETMKKPDGSITVLETSKIPFTADGKPAVLIAAADITERKRAEETLWQSRALLRLVLDNIPVRVFWKDRDLNYLGCNVVFARDAGLEDPQQLIGKDDFAMGWHEQAELYRRDDRRVIETGEPLLLIEELQTTPTGDTIHLLTSKVPLRDVQGTVIGVLGTYMDVTELKRAEEALKDASVRVSLATKAAGVGVWEHDLVHNRLEWDEQMFALYGISRETFGGAYESWRACVHPEDMARADEEEKMALCGEKEFDTEFRVVWPDGTVRHIQALALVLRDADGKPLRTIGTNWDITQRKRAEEALREQRDFSESLIETAQAIILVLDTRGRIVRFNPYMKQLVGYELDEVKGMDWFETFLTPEIDRTIKPLFEKTVADVYTSGNVNPIIAKDGRTILVEWYNKTLKDKDGRTVGVLAIGQDITERKQAEEALIRQQRSIKLTNRIANVFLTSSRSEVFADVLDVILMALGSRFGYFGYIDEAGDLVCPSLTRDVWDQCQVTEKSIVFPRTGWGGLWGRSLTEKQTLIANENLRIPEGHVALENALATPIVHHDNLIGQFVVANKAGGYDKDDRDLLERAAAQTAPILFAIREEARRETAHKRLEDQLRQAQKMEAVGRLAGGVAHDFNNMLGVIIGHAEMLLEQMDTNHPFHADLAQIRKAGARSADLTRQLLAFARKQTVAPKVLDLNETVESMLKLLQRLIGEDIDLLWKPGHGLWPVRMDPAQIDQILANLCVNARDAIAGVGKMTIETGNTVFDEAYREDHAGFVPGEYSMLAVSDDGCGMDSETLSHIFEPFFTTKELGKGTGLGLATVYGVVKQNNGFINAYSEPGQGTTFKIYLPRHRAKEAPLPDKEAIRPAEPGHETILLVEDEPAILRMTTMMLLREGYTVLGAGTPGEAIRLATEHAGDLHLLMTDVVMPEMNGRVLAKNILSLYPHLKCLFMSGYTANVIAHHGVLDEGVNFIQKPFSKGDLTVKVREVLDRD